MAMMKSFILEIGAEGSVGSLLFSCGGWSRWLEKM